MCDEHYANDVEKTRVRLGLSRREFAAMTAAAGISVLLPHAAEAAVDVTEEEVILVPRMNAEFLHCVAQNDDMRDANNKVLLKETERAHARLLTLFNNALA